MFVTRESGSRTMHFTDIPQDHRDDLAELHVAVTYKGESNVANAIPLDSHVIPAIVAAFDDGIKVGSIVKSFDSEYYQDDNRRGFVYGRVVEIGVDAPSDPCKAYDIKVLRWFDHDGEPIPRENQDLHVFPPLNNTPKLMGKVTNGVWLADKTLQSGLTLKSKFDHVLPGQKFIGPNGEIHVRLFEETNDGWNCCELNTGCLSDWHPAEEVAI